MLSEARLTHFYQRLLQPCRYRHKGGIIHGRLSVSRVGDRADNREGGIVDESGTSRGRYVRGTYSGDSTFSVSNDGFSIKATNAATSGASSYEWYAIGY